MTLTRLLPILLALWRAMPCRRLIRLHFRAFSSSMTYESDSYAIYEGSPDHVTHPTSVTAFPFENDESESNLRQLAVTEYCRFRQPGSGLCHPEGDWIILCSLGGENSIPVCCLSSEGSRGSLVRRGRNSTSISPSYGRGAGDRVLSWDSCYCDELYTSEGGMGNRNVKYENMMRGSDLEGSDADRRFSVWFACWVEEGFVTLSVFISKTPGPGTMEVDQSSHAVALYDKYSDEEIDHDIFATVRWTCRRAQIRFQISRTEVLAATIKSMEKCWAKKSFRNASIGWIVIVRGSLSPEPLPFTGDRRTSEEKAIITNQPTTNHGPQRNGLRGAIVLLRHHESLLSSLKTFSKDNAR
ncbi:hypothetical protein HJC23_010077 [Cyclotella cryptica]|uniref:Uncharacterized protein n=1 Tax=Cyclotella cryptica TaxID=29204 RepID=A0ABD3Q2G8_9STRA